MPDGGVVTVQTTSMLVHDGSDRLPVGAAPGRHVVIEISDTGRGLAEDEKPHIFEPFFTTKPVGSGTGLGLATVYAIVQQGGGFIDVQSTPGVGATFRICWPMVEKAATEPKVSGDEPLAEGLKTILVCEDEAAVRELTCRILKEANYHVIAADNGQRALELVDLHGEPPDLLVTDTIMPEMNGRELAEVLVERHSDVRVLFVSGYSHDVLAPEGVLDDDTDFLPKPFNRGDLLRRVRAILDRQI